MNRSLLLICLLLIFGMVGPSCSPSDQPCQPGYTSGKGGSKQIIIIFKRNSKTDSPTKPKLPEREEIIGYYFTESSFLKLIIPDERKMVEVGIASASKSQRWYFSFPEGSPEYRIRLTSGLYIATLRDRDKNEYSAIFTIP